jgi:hypothetical protein
MCSSPLHHCGCPQLEHILGCSGSICRLTFRAFVHQKVAYLVNGPSASTGGLRCFCANLFYVTCHDGFGWPIVAVAMSYVDTCLCICIGGKSCHHRCLHCAAWHAASSIRCFTPATMRGICSHFAAAAAAAAAAGPSMMPGGTAEAYQVTCLVMQQLLIQSTE